MKEMLKEIESDFLKLARVALSGRIQDIQLVIHRASKKYKSDFPQLAEGLISLLQESPTRSSPLRKQSEVPLPVDVDSRLQLLRVEDKNIDTPPILADAVNQGVKQILSERNNSAALIRLGLHPTKSILFTGPPGVGKTLSARWIAFQLKKPLLILDLAAVMSSYLGRTGNNIRFVLDYAKSIDCVLLLDELDAIAKRRDDQGEIGELKRLVTVLLQEIDDWPSTGLLIAATNHPALLDPAVWRRFEMVIEFPKPSRAQIKNLLHQLLKGNLEKEETWSEILSYVFIGKSFSEIERQILISRRLSAVENKSLENIIESLVTADLDLTHDQKVQLACTLIENNIVSQRRAQELTGIARETLRKKMSLSKNADNN